MADDEDGDDMYGDLGIEDGNAEDGDADDHDDSGNALAMLISEDNDFSTEASGKLSTGIIIHQSMELHVTCHCAYGTGHFVILRGTLKYLYEYLTFLL